MLEAHVMILHARNPKSNLRCLNDYLCSYGVPNKSVDNFVSTGSLVSSYNNTFLHYHCIVLLY